MYIKLNELPYYKGQLIFKHQKWFQIMENKLKLTAYYNWLEKEKIRHVVRSLYNNTQKE